MKKVIPLLILMLLASPAWTVGIGWTQQFTPFPSAQNPNVPLTEWDNQIQMLNERSGRLLQEIRAANEELRAAKLEQEKAEKEMLNLLKQREEWLKKEAEKKKEIKPEGQGGKK